MSLCFLGLGFLLRFLGFLKLMDLCIEVPKAYVNTFESYYTHFHSLIEDFLVLELWFLSKINIFWINLHLTYQYVGLWRPPSLSYSAFFSDLFVCAFWGFKFRNDHIISWIGLYYKEIHFFSLELNKTCEKWEQK